MATEQGNVILSDTCVAGEALTAYKFVRYDTDDQEVALAAGNDAVLKGVTMEVQATVGKTVNVACIGRTLLTASAVIAKGARINSTSAGKGVTAGAAEYYHAIAEEAAAADGDNILVTLCLNAGKTPA